MHALTDPLPGDTRRLLTGLVASIGIHVLLVLGIGANFLSHPYVGPLPLQVELRREAAPPNAAALAADPPSELSTEPPPAVVPESPRQGPQPAPGVNHAPKPLDLPIEKYFTAREVDVRAEPINEVDLVYPQLAYQMRISGKVMLRILVDERGGINEVSLLEATPPGIFEQAALTATLALQFKPAIKNGRNVKSEKTIEVSFDPYESINIP